MSKQKPKVGMLVRFRKDYTRKKLTDIQKRIKDFKKMYCFSNGPYTVIDVAEDGCVYIQEHGRKQKPVLFNWFWLMPIKD